MIFTKLTFFLLIVAVTFAAKDYCSVWREVKHGDSCAKIVHETKNMKLEALKQYNPGMKCDKLTVGDKICVIRTAAQLPCKQSHKVMTADTCAKITAAYKIGERQMKDWNENLNCAKLPVGKEVCVKR